MNSKLSQIQAKIREVCPETVDYHPGDRLRTTPGYRTLGLPHVLRAIGEGSGRQYEYVLGLDGHILEMRGGTELGLMTFEGTGVYWNLYESLAHQDDSVIDFLFTILFT